MVNGGSPVAGAIGSEGGAGHELRREWPPGAALGEGPVWDDRDGSLVWIDIFRAVIHRLDPVRHETRSRLMPWIIGSIALRRERGYVVAKQNGFALLDENLDIEWEIDVTPMFGWRFNEGQVDPQGNFWSGAMTDDFQKGAARTFVLRADRSVVEVEREATLPNGLAWTDGGERLLYVDSKQRALIEYQCWNSGEQPILKFARNLSTWSESEGVPDGIAVDRNGSIWVAMSGAGVVCRLSREGVIEEVVPVPARQPTSLTFGGDHLNSIFVTSAACDGYTASNVTDPAEGGGLFSFRPSVGGLPANRFGG